MSLIPGVRIDPRLRIDPWIGFTPDVSSGLLKCTRSGTTAKLLRMMDLTARIRHNIKQPPEVVFWVFLHVHKVSHCKMVFDQRYYVSNKEHICHQ